MMFQTNFTFLFIFFLSIIFIPIPSVSEVPSNCYKKHPTEMSVEEIEGEISMIQETRAAIGLYHAQGDEIQLRSKCANLWKIIKATKREWKTMKNRMVMHRELDALKVKQARTLEEYKTCFTKVLSNGEYPRISEHQVDPAQSIEEFDANLSKLESSFSSCRMASRFSFLRSELSQRQE